MDQEFLNAIRAVVREEVTSVKQELKQEIASVREELKQEIASVREDVEALKAGQRQIASKIDYLSGVVDEVITLHDELEQRVKVLEDKAV